jgi:phospholipid/cholesterol/gamma-HCH transport system substrate-binding protein
MSEILSEDNVKHIGQTLQNVDQLTATLADQRNDIGTAARQLAEATAQIKTTLTAINKMADTTNGLMREDVRNLLQSTQKALATIDKVAGSADALIDDNRGAIDRFANQGLRQLGPTLSELHETLRSLKQLSDKLGASDSLLLGRDQPKEYQPR